MHDNRKDKKLKSINLPLLATCSAIAICSIPSVASAQLSIMGVLDTRASFNNANQKQTPHYNSLPQSKQASPQRSSNQHFPDSYSSPTATSTPQQPNEQTTQIGAGNTSLSADEIMFQRDLGVITARGAVEIVYEDQVLIADTVSFNQNKNVVTASGNVQLIEENGDVILAEFIEITSDLKNGVANQLVLSMADKSHIRAEKAKRNERFTIAENAEYSACQKCAEDPERPLVWKLSAKEVKHDKEQRRIEYSDVFLEVFDVPILYTPFFAHPDPTRKRETGFLFPSYGSRGSIGSFVSTPFFWAISPSKDLTLEPTFYYDDAQPFLEAEYRQHTTKGKIRLKGSATYIKQGGEGQSSGNAGDEIRGHIDSEGQFDIDNTWRWGFDINHASDDTYIRRYALDDRSDNSQLISELYTEGFRKRNYMVARLNRYLEQRDIDTTNLQNHKAEYIFSHISQPSSTGSYWKMDGGFHHITRESNLSSTRLAAETSWVVPYTSATGDLITFDANLITAGYYISEPAVENGYYIDDSFHGAIVPSASIEWKKPLSRTHMDGNVNEVLEPIVKVKVAPNVGAQNFLNEDSQDFEFDETNLFETNRFTGIDKIEGGQRIDYGFNWGIFGKNGGFSQMSIGQSYRLRDDNTYDSNSGHRDNLSDIVGSLRVAPSDFLNATYRYRLDKDDFRLNRSETSVSIGPTSTKLRVSHLFIEGTGNSSEYGTREEVSTQLTSQLHKNWSSKLYSTYRLHEPKGYVNYGGRLGYGDECTTIYLDFSRSFSEDRDIEPSDSFTIRFELKNLGGIGSF